MIISAGITTRNRPEYLRLALQHFLEYSKNINIIVIDDNSDNGMCQLINKETCESLKYGLNVNNIKLSYYYNETRLGIAKSKNECLRKMAALNTEHFFLFDDDCFPKKQDWEKCYIQAAQKSNAHHLMHLTPFSIIQPVKAMEHITAYNNCAGVMLYIDRKVVENVGGYDTRFGLYGYEHAQYSKRIHQAKLSGEYIYNTPNASGDYIYSLDINFGWYKELPPFADYFSDKLYSSVTKQEANTAADNAYLMNDCNCKIKVEL
jgi:glycosyltransferase involved in cell wall biosynthesis